MLISKIYRLNTDFIERRSILSRELKKKTQCAFCLFRYNVPNAFFLEIISQLIICYGCHVALISTLPSFSFKTAHLNMVFIVCPCEITVCYRHKSFFFFLQTIRCLCEISNRKLDSLTFRASETKKGEKK